MKIDFNGESSLNFEKIKFNSANSNAPKIKVYDVEVTVLKVYFLIILSFSVLYNPNKIEEIKANRTPRSIFCVI